MSSEDLEKYETEMELQLYREYRDVVGLVYFDVTMSDAWVWDVYRPARFVKNVRVVTFKDVNVEELAKTELELPKEGGF